MARERERESGNDRVRKFWVFFIIFWRCQKHAKGVGPEQRQSRNTKWKTERKPKNVENFFEVVPINCAVSLWG